MSTKGAKLKPRNDADVDASIAATKHNEIHLRRLREQPAYKAVARTHPAHVEKILHGLLASSVAAEVVPTYKNPVIRGHAETLIAAGIPEVHISGLSERAVLDLQQVNERVRTAAFGAGDAARAANDAAVGALWNDPLFVQLTQTYGQVWARRVLPTLIAHHHGNAVPLGPVVEPAINDDKRIAQVEKIAELERTSGRWYSWSALTYLEGFANASSIFHHARSAAYSPQGYGLYVSNVPKGSQSYGKDPGAGIAIVDLDNVPTIKRRSLPEKNALAALYRDENYAEMLLMYQGEYGEFIWARLTTSRGVRVTTDLARLDPHDVRVMYDGITEASARANVKIQATAQGVDTAAWPVP